MAQAAREARLAGLPRPGTVRRPRLGLFVRFKETVRLKAQQSRQRHELSGYTNLQTVGRETGIRG